MALSKTITTSTGIEIADAYIRVDTVAGYKGRIEEELTRLETVFHELRTANAILMGDSTKSQQDLIRALKLLRESQEELKTLQALLTTLQAESKLAKSDLSQANAELAKAKKSFEQYAKEQRQLKTERILWGLAGIGIGLLMPK